MSFQCQCGYAFEKELAAVPLVRKVSELWCWNQTNRSVRFPGCKQQREKDQVHFGLVQQRRTAPGYSGCRWWNWKGQTILVCSCLVRLRHQLQIEGAPKSAASIRRNTMTMCSVHQSWQKCATEGIPIGQGRAMDPPWITRDNCATKEGRRDAAPSFFSNNSHSNTA